MSENQENAVKYITCNPESQIQAHDTIEIMRSVAVSKLRVNVSFYCKIQIFIFDSYCHKNVMNVWISEVYIAKIPL